MPDHACIDASFLAHAILPSQQTREATEAFNELLTKGSVLVAAPTLLPEFSSLLRGLVSRGTLTPEEGMSKLQQMLSLRPTQHPVTASLIERAWEISTFLGQGKTFDSIGYAAAEAFGGEFWTSDRRFANAAEQRGLPGIKFIR